MPPGIPVVAMNQSLYEKNGWSAQIATLTRPVWARASFTAAETTVEPSFANFTISRMGQHAEQRLGTLHLDRRRPVEIRPELHLADRGLDDRRVGMAQRHRTQAHRILDELAPVGVPHAAATPAGDERRSIGRILIVALGVGVAAARDEPMCSRAQRLGISRDCWVVLG